MRIIYLEDDLIDQRLFKRACRDVKDLEVTYYESCMGLKEEYLNSYDGIIIDQYLQDCSIKQFADKTISIPMAVLSASEKLISSHPGNLGIWQKPVKENILIDILSKMTLLKKDKTASPSLEYIKDLTQGNEAEKQELLKSIYISIEESNKILENPQNLSEAEIQQYLHKQKSKVGIFYLEDLHRNIDQTEDQLKNGSKKETVLLSVLEIVSSTKKLLSELKQHLD